MKLWIWWLTTGLLLAGAWRMVQAATDCSFGVLSQRSALLTARYWNPLLDYVQRRTGVVLQLKATRTAPESNAATQQGQYDFVYSNTIFHPSMREANYQVILRPRADAITGQLVTLEDSSIQTLEDLAGKNVGFPSKAAFVGYAVPMDHLMRRNIPVILDFGGNQEGIMGQLKAGKVLAAGVNSQVMKGYADREHLRYRVLWESTPFHNLPIAAHPRVDRALVSAVQQAIGHMHEDPEGLALLTASAAIIQQNPPLGFVPATQQDYQAYLDFYAATLVQDIE